MKSSLSILKNVTFIFLYTVLLHCCVYAIDIQVSVSPNAIKIGQVFTNHISLTSDAPIQVIKNLSQEDFKDIHLLSQSQEKKDNKLNIHYQLQVFSNNITHIPTLNLMVSKNNIRHKIIFPQYPLQLSSHFSTSEQQQAELSEIFDNISLAFPVKSFLFLIAVILFIIGCAWWVYKRFFKPKQNIEPTVEIPLVPALDEALEALNKLKEDNLYETKNYKAHYSRLSDIIKHFASRKTKQKLLETTTKECIKALTSYIPDYNLSKMSAILTCCDMVKFAKQIPDHDKHEQILEKANEWLHKVDGDIPDEVC